VSVPGPDELREKTRQQILDAMGGWSGTVVAAIPPIVFVIANLIGGLRPAIVAALSSAVIVALYRVVRRESLQQAVMGVFSVGVAALIAARTGEARGFFVLGIASAIGYAAVFAVSLVVRRPLVGVLWEFLEPSPLPEGQRWHKVVGLRRAYEIATLAALTMFASRAVVQLSLFRENRTGLLAIAKLVMGFPLYVAVVALSFWVVRRARHRLGLHPVAPDTPTGTTEQDETASGGADGVTDGGLRLGERDE
jgi:hypothetical protein